jgi:Flp pilus assembly protein TadD
VERLTSQQMLQVALAHQRAGRLSAAADLCRQIVAAYPEDADALHLQGVIAHARGEHALAARSLRRAVELRPEVPQLQHNLGAALLAGREFGEAAAVLRQAVARTPESGESHLQLGAALLGMGSLDEAVDALQRATQRRPSDADAWNNLGVALFRRGDADVAIDAFDRTLAIRPDAAAAHKNRGMALRLARRREEAVAAFERAAALRPEDHDAQNNLGVTFEHMREWERAIHHYRRSIALKPDDPAPQWNLARLLLLTADNPCGDFVDGWRWFESRLRLPYLKLARPFDKPHWRGEPIAGKTILLWTEGGYGDALHFIRYAPLVARLGATVLLECQPELATLLGSIPGISAVIQRGQPLPPFDVQAPLQSLPLAMGTTLETIPAAVPYLHVDAAMRAGWRERVTQDRNLRVGLSWAGSANPKDARSRTLDTFASLASVEGVSFYSLQLGREVEQPTPPGLRLQRVLKRDANFAETAALVANLDLVITVDTSVGHLAGALGVPTWIMVPFHPDFRWMLDRADSPWYPTVRLFRQKSWNGDWTLPVADMMAPLQTLAMRNW